MRRTIAPDSNTVTRHAQLVPIYSGASVKTHEGAGKPIYTRAIVSDSLTPTERNIALLVADGNTNSAIASRLCLAPGTVRNYISVIFDKLQITNRAALAVYALQNNLAGQAATAYSVPQISDPDNYKDLIFLAMS